MIIDNKSNVYRIWIRKLVTTLSFTILIIVVMFLDFLGTSGSSMIKFYVVIGISIVFVVVSILGVMRNPYYFYFDDSSDVLVIKYYPVGILNSKKHSAQIPKQHFVKYETTKFFFGKEERLHIYQHYRKKIAKYPPISLSAVNKEDREKLKLALTSYSIKK